MKALCLIAAALFCVLLLQAAPKKRAKLQRAIASAPTITHAGGGTVCVSRPQPLRHLNMIWLYVGPSPTDTPEMFGVDPVEGDPTCIPTQITDGRWGRVRLGDEFGPVTDFSNAIQFANL